MDNEKIIAYAKELSDAHLYRKAIRAFTERDDSFTIDEAYAVQLTNVQRTLKQGDTISGKKIGLTSFPMQELLGVDQPDFGYLLASMECQDGIIQSDKLLQPKIEAELAFILKEDLNGGNITVEDVDKATDYLTAALEIVDSRIADWKIKLQDTIADNASSAFYILGNKKLRPKEVDLNTCHMQLYKVTKDKDILINDGYGSAVLGDPRIAVAWLANKMHSYGVCLKAGEVILSGAFSAALIATKGDRFKAVFTDFGVIEAEFR